MKIKNRYIFVAGGVMSGIGKGIATASIGKILQDKGFKVAALKIDPYINVDAGTMNPLEHGEVFVTDDGIECDQDGGNYERFLNINFSNDTYITTGRVYKAVIEKERNLAYKGKCVEAIPHITNEIISRIEKVGEKTKSDFVLIEIGGTVGEYQNMIFFEAARIMKLKNPSQVLFILIGYLPVLTTIGEMKTKPTQQAAKWLNMAGIQPDIVLARAQVPLDQPRKEKISTFCNVSSDYVISAPDVKIIYKVPLNFEAEKLGKKILKKFKIKEKKRGGLKEWKKLLERIEKAEKSVRIGLVGKYFKTGEFVLKDSYVSVIEAVKHACWAFNRTPKIDWISAEKYEKDPKKSKELLKYDGVIILGGFGKRGVEGKIKAVQLTREKEVPTLGLCLGLQIMAIEFGRHVCGLKNANSTEFDPKTPYPIISTMEEQKKLLKNKQYGGTMRLGAYKCKLKQGTKTRAAYGKEIINERHRHRYELNNKYKEILEKRGVVMAGINPEKDLVEIIEIKKHPFLIGTQFHPEFKSRPLNPHPLFKAFIKAAIQRSDKH